MKTPILAALLSAPFLAYATPESDRVAALEARLAALESMLSAPQPVATPAPRPSRAAVLAAGQVASWQHPFFAAVGAPIFGYPGYGGGSGGASSFTGLTGTITSAQMIDPYVPVDGTANITGALAVSSTLDAGGMVSLTGATHRLAFTSGSTGTKVIDSAEPNGASAVALYIAARPDYTTSGAKILSIGDNAGTSYAEKTFVRLDGAIGFTPTALGIADSGGGGAATHTALPVGGIVEVTCSDADGCDWTPTETGATAGEIHHIRNTGTNTVTLVHAAGQVLLNGGTSEALGENDTLTIYYSSDESAWVQLGTTGNN